MHVDDAEQMIILAHLRTDVDTAAPADHEIGRASAEAITLQLVGLADLEFQFALRVGGGQRVVQTAEAALTGADAPALTRLRCAVGETDRAAVTTTFVRQKAHWT